MNAFAEFAELCLARWGAQPVALARTVANDTVDPFTHARVEAALTRAAQWDERGRRLHPPPEMTTASYRDANPALLAEILGNAPVPLTGWLPWLDDVVNEFLPHVTPGGHLVEGGE